MFGGWIHTQITKIGKNRPFLAGCLLVTGKSTSKLPSSHRASVAFRQPWIAMEWSVRVGAFARVFAPFCTVFSFGCFDSSGCASCGHVAAAVPCFWRRRLEVKGPELNLKATRPVALAKPLQHVAQHVAALAASRIRRDGKVKAAPNVKLLVSADFILIEIGDIPTVRRHSSHIPSYTLHCWICVNSLLLKNHEKPKNMIFGNIPQSCSLIVLSYPIIHDIHDIHVMYIIYSHIPCIRLVLLGPDTPSCQVTNCKAVRSCHPQRALLSPQKQPLVKTHQPQKSAVSLNWGFQYISRL